MFDKKIYFEIILSKFVIVNIIKYTLLSYKINAFKELLSNHNKFTKKLKFSLLIEFLRGSIFVSSDLLHIYM